MKLRNLLLTSVPLAVFSFAGCDVDVNDPGKAPEVHVEPGRAPDVEVRTPDVDVHTEKHEVTVPDVDVHTEKKEVEVPDVDVRVPQENDNAPTGNNP